MDGKVLNVQPIFLPINIKWARKILESVNFKWIYLRKQFEESDEIHGIHEMRMVLFKFLIPFPEYKWDLVSLNFTWPEWILNVLILFLFIPLLTAEWSKIFPYAHQKLYTNIIEPYN